LKTQIKLELLAKDAIKGVKREHIIVVIDVLRCSSTIITALANGAVSIIPVKTMREALNSRKSNPQFLLAGERKGLKPYGFEMGNSPFEFTNEKVSGRSIILTTTSGTKALIYSKRAKWVLIGAFLNAKMVAEKALLIAKKEGMGISLISSGKQGSFSLEDFICAGAIINRLRNEEVRLSDAAVAASLSFQQAQSHLCETVMQGEHAQDLIKLGFKKDVKFCCQFENYKVTPIYKRDKITLSE